MISTAESFLKLMKRGQREQVAASNLTPSANHQEETSSKAKLLTLYKAKSTGVLPMTDVMHPWRKAWGVFCGARSEILSQSVGDTGGCIKQSQDIALKAELTLGPGTLAYQIYVSARV